MALRFVSEHKSWSDGLTWKVEIHDSDFVGSETIFYVAAGGIDIEYRGDEDNLHWPILASTARFVMMVEDATHEQLITDMAGAKEGRFTIAIYKSGTFFWAGVINSPKSRLRTMTFRMPLASQPLTDLRCSKTTLARNQANDGTTFTKGKANSLQSFPDALKKCRTS